MSNLLMHKILCCQPAPKKPSPTGLTDCRFVWAHEVLRTTVIGPLEKDPRIQLLVPVQFTYETNMSDDDVVNMKPHCNDTNQGHMQVSC